LFAALNYLDGKLISRIANAASKHGDAGGAEYVSNLIVAWNRQTVEPINLAPAVINTFIPRIPIAAAVSSDLPPTPPAGQPRRCEGAFGIKRMLRCNRWG